MRISDLTKEQMLELLEITYNYSYQELIQKDREIKFKYQPYIDEWYEDAHEFVELKFSAITFGKTIDKMKFIIYSNLDCYLAYIRDDGSHGLPLYNIYKLVSKMQEFGLKPSPQQREDGRIVK